MQRREGGKEWARNRSRHGKAWRMRLQRPRTSVTVVSQAPGPTCTVENGAGPAKANRWTRVILKCSGEHSIGGVVSGLLPAEHLLLANHGQDYRIQQAGFGIRVAFRSALT